MKKIIAVTLFALALSLSTAPGFAAEKKELVVGVVQVTNNFDPYGAYGDEAYGHMQVYDTLVNRDKDGRIVGNVAESWQISPDGRQYTLKLRKGVKFTNGNAFNAEDAKFNIDKGKESPYTNWAMAGVDKCDVVDENTVLVTLTNPDISFMEKLTWLYMVDKETYEAAGEDYGKTAAATVGTGPYKLTEWKPGEMALFEANEDYFAGKAKIERATFESMSDANAAIISLQTGEIGLYIHDVPSISIASLSKNTDVKVTSYPSYVFMDVLMNCEKGIFADLRARKAVALGVDREKMFLIGTEGQGVIVDYPGGPDYTGNPNIKTFPERNEDEAAKTVKDLGLQGKPITIKTMDTDPWPKLATALQDDLNKIGFDAKVEILDNSTYSQEVWQKGDYDIAISRYWSATKDMSELMNLLATGHSMNFSHYSNKGLDPLLVSAVAVSDTAERAKIYEKAVRLFTNDFPLIPLFYTNGSRAYSSGLSIDEGNVQYDHIYYYSWK
ncbi:MAG: ABC transporter substrate-binding protein [Synergistaceae bacterium]|nr:ABC transporter substrate-binding protein [Synergistaceae bacterium]